MKPPPFDSDLRGMRVLYVEDNVDLAESASALLVSMGAHVSTFFTFDDARAHIEAVSGEGIDVFLTDLVLDNGHIGPDLLLLLRRTEHGRRVPAVLLTAFGTADDRAAAQAVGFVRHLVKPVDGDALARALWHAVDATASGHGSPGPS